MVWPRTRPPAAGCRRTDRQHAFGVSPGHTWKCGVREDVSSHRAGEPHAPPDRGHGLDIECRYGLESVWASDLPGARHPPDASRRGGSTIALAEMPGVTRGWREGPIAEKLTSILLFLFS